MTIEPCDVIELFVFSSSSLQKINSESCGLRVATIYGSSTFRTKKTYKTAIEWLNNEMCFYITITHPLVDSLLVASVYGQLIWFNLNFFPEKKFLLKKKKNLQTTA